MIRRYHHVKIGLKNSVVFLPAVGTTEYINSQTSEIIADDRSIFAIIVFNLEFNLLLEVEFRFLFYLIFDVNFLICIFFS
jgi:hypothetical protein